MDTMIIGIAGGTGSGQTTLTQHLKDHFGENVSVVYHDNYYKAHPNMPYEEAASSTTTTRTPSIPTSWWRI